MGTVTDQPVHYTADDLEAEADGCLSIAARLAQKYGISLEVALKACEVASRERLLDLGYSLHNVHDEHVAGFAKMLGERWGVRVP